MFSFLKNHPFPVEAHFDNSFVLTFAIAKEKVQYLLPECLELDLFNDRWAFVAIAMVQTKDLRPKGFPAFLGNDFFLIGYRIFVRYVNAAGRRLRGLYILKSETDKRKMEFLGNLFTHYNYTTTDISKKQTDNGVEFISERSGFSVNIETTGEIGLPDGSPFSDWKEARRFAGPLPFTFTFNSKTGEVLIIEGVRENWTPTPVRVIDHHFSFLHAPQFEGAVLANAFVIHNIPYWWKSGRIEQWSK
jgi:hypothetical protein